MSYLYFLSILKVFSFSLNSDLHAPNGWLNVTPECYPLMFPYQTQYMQICLHSCSLPQPTLQAGILGIAVDNISLFIKYLSTVPPPLQ